MGLYLNPHDGTTKEEFLRRHATKLKHGPNTLPDNPNCVLVCLVENPQFTAAGVAYSVEELVRFSNVQDTRPKTWYLMEKHHLKAGCVPSELAHYMPEVYREESKEPEDSSVRDASGGNDTGTVSSDGGTEEGSGDSSDDSGDDGGEI